MTDLLIELHFDKDKAKSWHILRVKLELQNAVRRLESQGINIPNPQLIAHEGEIKKKV